MTLHPQAKAFLDGLAEQQAPGWDELTPADGREVFSGLGELFGDGPEVAGVEDQFVGDDLAVRIYTPNGDGPFPAIVYFHGGGWVLGDLDTHDALCRRLAKAADAVVVAVDYRRSPETAFPGALEDSYAATTFVADQSASLNVDSTKLVVAGDSAGGNLATSVTLMARARGGPNIALQVLIYPVLDHRCASASYGEFAEGFGLTKASMQWFWQQYLGKDADGNDESASPLLANSLHDLPPAHIVTAQYDVLKDEGEQYVQRLQEAGVATTYRRYDGMLHGFVHFSGRV